MGREEGLLHLHTDRFLLFLCVPRLNLNRPTCPSTVFFNTSVLSFSPFLSLSCVCPRLPLSTSVPSTQSNHHKPLSHHLCIASSIPLLVCPAPSLHTLLCTVCVCVCRYNTPRGTILHRHWHVVDISAQFTGFLRLQRVTVFTSTPTYQCVCRRYYACLDYMFACVCAGHKWVSL